MEGKRPPPVDGWAQHRDEQRRARLALTPEQRLTWLWQAKLFAAAAVEAAERRRAEARDHERGGGEGT